MRYWKRLLAMLVSGILCVTVASAHGHNGDPGIDSYQPSMSDWAREEVEKAQTLGLTATSSMTDYRQPITREQFVRFVMEYTALQTNFDVQTLSYMAATTMTGEETEEYRYNRFVPVFSDGTGSVEEVAAYHLGLITGRGDGRFEPDGLITRQEAAVMLTRAYEVCGGTLPEMTPEDEFSDAEEIAGWAQESAAVLSSWKVMNGAENGSFDPKGHYSIEQCIITFLRLCENAPLSRLKGNLKPLFSYEHCMGYLEQMTEDTSGNGHYITMRLEGPLATLIRIDHPGFVATYSDLYFVYREGGLKSVDIGICDLPDARDITKNIQLDYCRFSEDGATFYCDVTLDSDMHSSVYELNLLVHEAGLYHITIDVETCQFQLEREDL